MYGLLILIFSLFVFCPFVSNSADLNQLYASDSKAFWVQWNKSKDKAISCKDYNAMSRFLSDAIITLGNAEVSEANAQIIEQLCMNNPKCVLEALLRLRPEQQNEIIRFFVSVPIFHGAAEIKVSLGKFWNEPIYRPIKEMFLKSEHRS